MGLRPTHGNEKHARPIFGGEQQANPGAFFNGAVGPHLSYDRSQSQLPIAVYRVCVPATPPRVKVIGVRSSAGTLGTTTLNW